MLETEILEAITSLVRIGDHLRRPGAKVLNATNFYARVMDIDPVIVKHLPILQNQHDGEEIAILQAFGRADGAIGNLGR